MSKCKYNCVHLYVHIMYSDLLYAFVCIRYKMLASRDLEARFTSATATYNHAIVPALCQCQRSIPREIYSFQGRSASDPSSLATTLLTQDETRWHKHTQTTKMYSISSWIFIGIVGHKNIHQHTGIVWLLLQRRLVFHFKKDRNQCKVWTFAVVWAATIGIA